MNWEFIFSIIGAIAFWYFVFSKIVMPLMALVFFAARDASKWRSKHLPPKWNSLNMAWVWPFLFGRFFWKHCQASFKGYDVEFDPLPPKSSIPDPRP